MKPILISGIQPTGRLHLGNYLGALKNFVELQDSNKYQCLFFVADLHSLTEDFKPSEKRKQVPSLLADYLAIGLKPSKSVLFIQSAVPAHSELAWIMNTISYYGELSRMTQFKDKAKQQKENNNVGLFTYPLLMTADILLYDVVFVPVGEDQIQHLELARDLARRFNKRFGKTFTEPKPLLTPTPRIMDLKNPKKKMSKSSPEGCLFIDDSPKEITKKIKTAVTDTGKEIKYDIRKKAGVSNLLSIYSALSEKSIKILEKELSGKGYGDFKKSLTKLVADYFKDYRKQKKELMKKPEQILKIANKSNKKANMIAEKKMAEVKNKLGLLIK